MIMMKKLMRMGTYNIDDEAMVRGIQELVTMLRPF